MELKHEQQQPVPLTEAELLARREHWDGHRRSCEAGLALAVKHLVKIDEQLATFNDQGA
jgi:hypothetical protein